MTVFQFFVHFGRIDRFIVRFKGFEAFCHDAVNVDFQQVWTFLPNFKIECCLTVFVVSEQVLIDLGLFCTSLIKNEFFLEEEFVLVFGPQKKFPSGFNHSVADFDVFKRTLFFVLFDRFRRL